MSDTNQLQPFNGISAVTGDYGLKLSAEELVQRVFGEGAWNEKLRQRQEEFTTAVKDAQKKIFRNVREDVDATNLAEAGWGIIFAAQDPNKVAIQEALQPLLTLRKAQANPYKVFEGTDAYYPNETKTEFLRRFKVGTGAVDPTKGVPYYLLLIGSPELIPFEFQYQLDVQFAVGRLDFDTREEYANYARAVVAAETSKQQLARSATFFSTVNNDDSTTRNSDRYLIEPLVKALAATPDWTIISHRGEAANRSQLEALMGGNEKPALLFTASQGIEFPSGDPRQYTRQGALLCSDWPGPKQWQGALREDFYFAGEHLAESANPSGMIAFHFACFSGGTPQYYDFDRFSELTQQSSDRRTQLAEHPFVANLPKRLLGHPKGGALAVVSHVDRAWSYSFRQGETPQTSVFEDTLTRLFRGQPLGWALEFFNGRYAELSADLNNELNRLRWNPDMQPYEIATLWTENHDARNFVVLGDPAVRVAVSQPQTLAMVAGRVNRPPAITVYDDGRPITVSTEEWAKTPQAVRDVLATALQHVNELTTALKQNATSPAMRQPVLRDGGRSSGSQVRSAATRGGATRDGGTLRGGVSRGGATRGGQPPTDKDDTDH